MNRYELTEDKITLERILMLHPHLRDEVLMIYREILKAGIAVRFTSTLRTIEEQDRLYEMGRTRDGNKVTNARGGQSYHNYGLAVDFCLLLYGGRAVSWSRNVDYDFDGKKDWLEVVAIFKKHGWEWGGNWKKFKDYPHFQKTFNLKTPQLYKQVMQKNVVEGIYPVIDVNPFV